MRSPWLRANLAITARAVVLLVLVAAILAPADQAPDKGVQAIVLVDGAASDASDEALARLAGDLGDTAKLTIEPVRSDIESATRNALWQMDPAMQGAIIIASDGYWHPDALAPITQARAAGIPVFWLPVSQPDDTHRVISVTAPDRARAGQRIRVSVDISAPSPADIVLFEDDRQVARVSGAHSGATDFQIDVPNGGPLIFGAEIHEPATASAIASLRPGALVNVAAPPTILVVSARPSTFAASLRNGGWNVTELPPQALSGRLEILSSFAGLVLDDVAIRDLTSATWTAISGAVRDDALGLLVLGGPNSFSLGAYRGSEFESLLPVVSEPPEQEAPTSLLFLIDVSGSMGRTTASNRRLQVAKQAVTETAIALRPVDRVGLITFDIDAEELLPLESRPDHGRAIEQAWPEQASGGTKLLPSLRQAVNALQKQDNEQKLLLLVTDGFLASEDLDQLEDLLRDSEVELIMMIIDTDKKQDMDRLERIAGANRGRAIPVDDILRLPLLMRSEVESRRPAMMTTSSAVRVISPASWMPGDAWPNINAHLVTRAKEAAVVHLQADNGDVLVASINAGAGKVVAVTSGFAAGAARWLQWRHWPTVAAGLTNVIAARSTGNISIEVREKARAVTEVVIELADRRQPNTKLVAALVDPTGERDTIELESRSPGQLGADLQLSDIGQYTLTVDDGRERIRHRFLHHARTAQEPEGMPNARKWLNDDVVQLWHAKRLSGISASIDWRMWLSGIALFSYLLFLVAERMPLTRSITELWKWGRRKTDVSFRQVGSGL